MRITLPLGPIARLIRRWEITSTGRVTCPRAHEHLTIERAGRGYVVCALGWVYVITPRGSPSRA